ncbi:MAG: class I SAM-dependent RNA methyltransferase [Ruminococcaceae bacterium]|nr:class I SAM-dependent RNA methyltransferase [Oscillospiraceae bacterium]
MNYRFVAPCLFGLEGPLGNELRHMDMKDVTVENGRVGFTTDLNGLARANIKTRFAERVLLEIGRFKAKSFDDLFEGVKRLPLSDYIPKNGQFPVKGFTLNSELHSVPDCQKIIKKAAAENLKSAYKMSWCPDDGEMYQIQFYIMKDEAVICLDTSGTGLHKRGYRKEQVEAPLRETLAAAMVDIAGYRGRGDFADPFCGSGTIAIEAALAAKNRAPGLYRNFSAEKWAFIDESVWEDERQAAKAREYSGEYRIFASDIDESAVQISKENAKRAGVLDIISFSVADAKEFSLVSDRGTIVTNPPYGERMLEIKEAEALIAAFGARMKNAENWSTYLLSPNPEFERIYGAKASKTRKLYNGNIKCMLYMYKTDFKRISK